MHMDLDQLLKLQVIDYDLGELERSKEYLPDMIENLHREIREAREKAEQTTRLLEEARLKRKSLELEIATQESSLERFQKQMMTIKTNREYDALVAEIDVVKGGISAKETELLHTLEQLSQLEEELPRRIEELKQVQENDTRQLQVLKGKMDSIGDKVAGKEAERQAVLAAIPRAILAIYERVRRGKSGPIVVAVRKRSCSACHNGLTPQRIQEIRRGDRIHTCDACGRLIYWDDHQSD